MLVYVSVVHHHGPGLPCHCGQAERDVCLRGAGQRVLLLSLHGACLCAEGKTRHKQIVNVYYH